MEQYTPTASVSDRHGWEWNRVYGDGTERGSSHPRTFDPARYDTARSAGNDVEQLEREIERLRREIELQEQHREEIIQQYERCLAEKNRKLGEQGSDSDGDHVLSTVLDPLRE